jgi:GNAT superfamily N-acetyltransferase
MEIEVVETVDADELVALYNSVGWTAYTADPESLAAAIARSTYVVTARHDGELIGLARGLSDDVAIFYLQDILVHPGWQREGIGRLLLSACLERFAHVRQKVLLTDAEQRQHRFYESMGYWDTRRITSAGLHAFVQIRGMDPDVDGTTS